jgi:hypothetical protein
LDEPRTAPHRTRRYRLFPAVHEVSAAQNAADAWPSSTGGSSSSMRTSAPAIRGGPDGTRYNSSRPHTSTPCLVWSSRDHRVAARRKTRWPTTSRRTPPDFDLPVRRGSRVHTITKKADRLVIIANDQRFEADNVVLATGAYQVPYLPGFANELDAGILQLHSSEYRTPSQLQDGDVLVLGAANSGAGDSSRGLRHASNVDFGAAPWQRAHPPRKPVDRIFTPPFWFYISRVSSVTNPIGRRLRPRMLKMALPLGRIKPKDLDAAGAVRLPRTIALSATVGLPWKTDGSPTWRTSCGRPVIVQRSTGFTSTSLIKRVNQSTTVG